MSDQLRDLQLSEQEEVAVTKPLRSALKSGPSEVRKGVSFAPVVKIRSAAGRKGADHRTGDRLPCCGGKGEHIMRPNDCPSVVRVRRGFVHPLADGGVNPPWRQANFWDNHPWVTRVDGRRTFDVRLSNISRLQFARPIDGQ